MKRFLTALAILCILVAPFGVYPIHLMHVMCIAIFATAFNLLFGYTGMLSFGHAAFFGFAAYITGYSVTSLGLTPELAIVAGGLAGALLGWVIGALAVKREGIMFAMITFAFSEVVYFICLQAPFTGGENGLQPVTRGHLFGLVDLNDDRSMYYFVLSIFVLSLLFLHRIAHSPFGQMLKAIKDNESRAISLGYKTQNYKLATFVISATIAGIAGGLKTLVFQVATLSDVTFHRSGEVVLMTLLGGTGSFIGPTIGAGIVVGLQDVLAGMGEWVNFVLGAIFVFCVLILRDGIAGEWKRRMGH